jgi:hypothetical protein
MVIVTDVIEKINSQTEKPFVLLEISGGLEMVQSQGTGKFYATMRKCRVPSTFNLDVAKMQISPPFQNHLKRGGFFYFRTKWVAPMGVLYEMETSKQRRSNYEKLKTAKNCTEKKESIHSRKRETLLKRIPISLTT